MRRARIVRIEWDDHALEPLDSGEAAGNVIVLPDHYNLNQKLATVSPEDYAATRLEVVFCGRTLENAAGKPVKDQSGKQMYEWFVGKVPVLHRDLLKK